MTDRVWDAFLTEQDRRSLELLPPRGERIGDRPALLLIDVYRGAFGDEPLPLLESVRRWPGSCGLSAWRALPHIVNLLQFARSLGIPVVHATGYDVSETGIERWSARPGSKGARGLDPEQAAARRRGYEFMPEVAPLPGEAVVRKLAPSAFAGTGLLPHLVSNGVDTLIVAGEATSGCVRASVVDARTHGFRVIVIEECTFDRHEATHAINLFDMHQKYGSVLSLEEAYQALGAVVTVGRREVIAAEHSHVQSDAAARRATLSERTHMATKDRRIYVRELSSGEYNLEEFRQHQLEHGRVRNTDIDDYGRPFAEDHEAGSIAPWRVSPGDDEFLTQTVQVHFRNIRPGQKSGKHGHQNEAIFYILEGQGYDIDDETRYEYSAGDTLIVNNDSVHQHFNASDTEWCKILVFKAKSLYLMLGLVEQGREKAQPAEKFGPQESWGGIWTKGVEDLTKVIKASDGEWVDDKRIGHIRRIVDKDQPGVRCFSMDVFEQIVEPGQSSVEHRHMADEVMYIISGKGESAQRDVRPDIDERYRARVSKDLRTFSFKAGDVVYVPHNCIHQFTNTGDQPLRFLSGQNRAFRHLGYDNILVA